jgi:2-oxoglutarate dehydrogenase E1 component
LKPLVIFTPKSLLRSAKAVSSLSEFTEAAFQEVIDDTLDASAVRRVVFCSGKIYYDLVAAREAKGIADIAIVRVEELHPFPHRQVTAVLERYRQDVDLIWCQEEPRNMGAWRWIYGRFLDVGRRLKYAGRLRNASPAAGSPKRHAEEHKRLIDEALG